ncbi:MAG: cell division protein FtsZ [Proteobacteria bacterium]|nr:cell division protein FtsZ [Pseudomonadota bacterium]
MSIGFKDLHLKNSVSGMPKIQIFGVGGGGGNVINRMIDDDITSVEYVAANTDTMVLNSSKADIKLALGRKTTRGLGAGMRPEIGKSSAEEAEQEIRSILKGSDLVFIAAGLGGGTGTGAAPVIAEIAQSMGILTVAVLTTPFRFEGSKRSRLAEEGIVQIKKFVDTFIIVPNNGLLQIASPKMTMTDAFLMADDVLKQGIRGIINLIDMEGVINLDFADIRTVMSNKGNAVMGIGQGQGEDRGLIAARAAICSPLIKDQTILGAKGVIINIVADENFTLMDAEAATGFIEEKTDSDADVIFGLVYDKDRKDSVSITIIATGFEREVSKEKPAETTKTHLRLVNKESKTEHTTHERFTPQMEDMPNVLELSVDMIESN